jgi:hypothetical protein
VTGSNLSVQDGSRDSIWQIQLMSPNIKATSTTPRK